MAIATLVVAAESRAQTTLEILNGGKRVEQVVDISAILDEGKVPIATTSAMGQVTIPATTTAFREGERVYVYVKRCVDGEVEIILSRSATDDPCVDDDAQAGQDCDCDDPIGFFLWGDDSVVIDIGTNTVGPPGTGAGSAPREDHSFADLQVGAMLDYSSFYNWKDVGCDQSGIASCDADGGAPGVGLYLDYRFGRSPFGLSFEAHYAKLDIAHTFQSGGDLPSRSEGDVNSWAFQAAGVYSYGFSPRLAWYGRAGYAALYDDAKFTTTFGTGPVTEDRTNTASQLLIGTGFHFPIGENWCGRTGVDLTTAFDSENGDENVRFSFALGYRMNRD
jgi:hypothetical protein